MDGTGDEGMLSRALDPQLDPVQAFATLYGAEPAAFWLDSSIRHGRSIMGAAGAGASVLLEDADGTARMSDPRTRSPSSVTIVDTEAALRARFRRSSRGGESQTDGFVPGWYGWFGYEWGARRAGAPVHRSRYPDAALMYADRGIVFDHDAGTTTAYACVSGRAGRWGADLWLDNVEGELEASTPWSSLPFPPTEADWRWRHDDSRYIALIERCKAAITRGDAYQLCLTNELSSSGSPDPFETYLRLRALSPTERGGFIRIGGVTLLSTSPELFLAVDDGRVTTRPIKGTRARGSDESADAALALELRTSAKEQAENIMIVDLMRNDLGRVAALGTVDVVALLDVESYAQVHQLVSTVTARLTPGRDALNALAAMFPAGSMTGAPKPRAMQLLHELEAGPRGAYSGCFGRLGRDGSAALAMVIRSIVIDPAGVTIGAGGGITALSDPFEELEEVKLKARALVAAVGGPTNL